MAFVENIKTYSWRGFRSRLEKVLYSERFENFIAVLIGLNAIVLAALTYKFSPERSLGQSTLDALLYIDMFIMIIFAVEMVLKLIALGPRFFRSGWNIFDLTIISVGMLGQAYPLSVLRSLRILRSFRLVYRVQSMRVVVESFLRSIPGIASVFALMMIFLFVFSVMGTVLFSAVAPQHFGSLQSSAFTLFTVLTLEGWPDVAQSVINKVPGSWVFFVVYVAINSFVILNLMIAVIVEAMHREYNAEADEERDQILDELVNLRRDIQALIKNQKP